MKMKIFDLLNKINSPILVLNNSEIKYLNNYFLETYLQEFYLDFFTIDKLSENWEIDRNKEELIIINKKSKIKHRSSFLTEFIENEEGKLEYYQVYKFQENMNFRNSYDYDYMQESRKKFFEKQKSKSSRI